MTENQKKWDSYFLGICKSVSANATCFSRQIGAILVKDKTVIATGYNGPPRGVPHCDERHSCDSHLISKLRETFDEESIQNHELFKGKCPRQILGYKSGCGLDICIAGHAEKNCIANAARVGGVSVKDSTLYMNTKILSCTPCLISLINAGVTETVVLEANYYDEQSKYLYEHSGMKIREFIL